MTRAGSSGPALVSLHIINKETLMNKHDSAADENNQETTCFADEEECYEQIASSLSNISTALAEIPAHARQNPSKRPVSMESIAACSSSYLQANDVDLADIRSCTELILLMQKYAEQNPEAFPESNIGKT